jgi:single-stranded-DNA-specific exonuclease
MIWILTRLVRLNTDMAEWIEPYPVSVPEELVAAAGGNPLVAKVLYQRGFTQAEQVQAYLNPDLYQPASAYDLPDMGIAVERLQRALQHGERICVWGDFDVDGQTSTTLLVDSLRQLGGRPLGGRPLEGVVSYHIPLRATEGHGIQLTALQNALDEGVDLLVTCDTGIGAHASIDYANSRGVDVIVTDHHDLSDSLPAALAVINPHRLPEGHPLSYLPGVGVAYQLIAALSAACGQPEIAAAQLDLVALGIVADVALLHGDCRYLLQRGLARLRAAERAGLRALYERAELNPAGMSEEHISFVIAPRLNAIGRLGDANPVVDFLTSDDLVQARVFALQLEALNERRKLLSEQIFQGAQTQLDQDPELLQHAALVLAHPQWPPGVIGIVASRLVERYAKPVILLNGPQEGPWRGSARSIPPVHITEAIAAIAAQADLLEGFGGHPMAAGMQVKAGKLDEFRQRLAQAVQAQLAKTPYDSRLSIDAYLPLQELNLAWVQEIERLAPFGAGSPALTLATRDLIVQSSSQVGRESEHRIVSVADAGGATQRILWWNSGGLPLPPGKFDLAYIARTSTFRGQLDVQVEWRAARLHLEEATTIEVAPSEIEISDVRRHPRPAELLRELAAKPSIGIWGEAVRLEGIHFTDRNRLAPAEQWVIWTTPPGPQELRRAAQIVSPTRVYLFTIDPGLDCLEPFLQRLAGLIKHTLSKYAGRGNLTALAAAMAHRTETILYGLDWFEERGSINYTKSDDLHVQIQAGDNLRKPGLAAREAVLKHQLEETAAFRNYLRWADPQQIANLLGSAAEASRSITQ